MTDKKDDFELDDLDFDLGTVGGHDSAEDVGDEVTGEHLDPSLADSAEAEMVAMASDVPVQVVAVMGKKTVSLNELVEMRVGHVVELQRPLNESVDLVANGKLVAKGELVNIDGKMGVRIVKMVR